LADVEKNINALLKSMFTKMELVTREEFDVQAEVLRNTRQKLEGLEAKLAALEELTQAAVAANKETEQVKSPT